MATHFEFTCISNHTIYAGSFIEIVEQLKEHQRSSESPLDEKLNQIEHYIENNCADPNLSVQSIADEFHLSLPYLSREFKRAKGKGVLSYINERRVYHAKQLMRESGMTIADVACQVGYTSSHTLIRIFKRYEGITPGAYRDDSEQTPPNG